MTLVANTRGRGFKSPPRPGKKKFFPFYSML
jgi:hypothetical protein